MLCVQGRRQLGKTVAASGLGCLLRILLFRDDGQHGTAQRHQQVRLTSTHAGLLLGSFSCIKHISSMSCPSTLAFGCREQGHVRSQALHDLPSGPQGACTLDTRPDVQSQATQSHSTGHSSDSVIGSALPHSHRCKSHAAMQFPHSSTAAAQLDVSPPMVASAPKPSSRGCRESGQAQAGSTPAVAATATTSVPAAAAAAAASAAAAAALAAALAAAAATTMVRAAAAAPAAAPATVAAPGTWLRLPELTDAQAVQAQTSHSPTQGQLERWPIAQAQRQARRRPAKGLTQHHHSDRSALPSPACRRGPTRMLGNGRC